MATIDSVKLPDNSTYDLTDNYSGYAKKVASATTDDLASLTATGDLADSGKKLSDLVLKSDVKDVLNSTSTTDPLSANQGRVLADNLAANENVYGAKNLIPYPFYETTKADNGITFTDNGDGSITVSGTASANANFFITINSNNEKKLDYEYPLAFTGTPSNSYGIISYVDLYDSNNQFYQEITDSGAGGTLPTGYYPYSIGVSVPSGANISTPIVIKPMLRDARILDDTFVPFAETNLQLTRKTSGLSNRNLVDNGWFTVNQRGWTSGASIANAYCVDRWKMNQSGGSGTVAVSSSGISITSASGAGAYLALQQYFENTTQLIGKVVTASVMLSDGTIYKGTGTVPSSGNINLISETNFGVNVFANIFQLYAQNNVQVNIRAVKLELGSVSTLHLDVAPDPITELLKCQRYFERVKLLGIGNSQSVIGIGYAVSATVARMTIFAKAKRDIPTITTSGTLTLHDGSSVTALSYEEMTDTGIVVNATSSGLTPGNVYLLRLGDTTSYIDFASDL